MLVGPMPSVSLKTIIFIHWCFFIWAVAGWGVAGYLYCNLSVVAIGVWAVADRQSVDALFLYILMMLCSVVLDIVCLALYFPGNSHSGFQMFGAVMAILNLILKPFTTVLVYQMYLDRGGEYNINFGPNSTSYDNIGDESAGSSADLRNVLQPGPTPPHGDTGYHTGKPQPVS